MENIIFQKSTLRCKNLHVKYTLILGRTAPCMNHCHIGDEFGDGEITLQAGTLGC
jgi:hypothetical protein